MKSTLSARIVTNIKLSRELLAMAVDGVKLAAPVANTVNDEVWNDLYNLGYADQGPRFESTDYQNPEGSGDGSAIEDTNLAQGAHDFYSDMMGLQGAEQPEEKQAMMVEIVNEVNKLACVDRTIDKIAEKAEKTNNNDSIKLACEMKMMNRDYLVTLLEKIIS